VEGRSQLLKYTVQDSSAADQGYYLQPQSHIRYDLFTKAVVKIYVSYVQ